MGGIFMRQFDLEEYLKNPELKVVTRDGRDARIICTDKKGGNKAKIVALIYDAENKKECISSYYPDGKFLKDTTHNLDLFFAPTKHEGWTNIYQISNGGYSAGTVYNTEQDSKAIAKGIKEYVTTIKVEWEE